MFFYIDFDNIYFLKNSPIIFCESKIVFEIEEILDFVCCSKSVKEFRLCAFEISNFYCV